MTTKLKENLIAFFVAILLTGGVIVAINSSDNLTTNILGTKNDMKITSDMKLVYSGGKMELLSNKNIPNVSSISLELLFNKDTINVKKSDLNSDYNFSASEKDGTNGYNIIFQNIGEIKKGKVVLYLNNITKKQYDNINIGHIQIFNNNGNIVNLTISK